MAPRACPHRSGSSGGAGGQRDQLSCGQQEGSGRSGVQRGGPAASGSGSSARPAVQFSFPARPGAGTESETGSRPAPPPGTKRAGRKGLRGVFTARSLSLNADHFACAFWRKRSEVKLSTHSSSGSTGEDSRHSQPCARYLYAGPTRLR